MGMVKGDGAGDGGSIAALLELLDAEMEMRAARRESAIRQCGGEVAAGGDESETWGEYCARVEAEFNAAEVGGAKRWPPIEEQHPFADEAGPVEENPRPLGDESAGEPADFEDPEGWMIERPRYWLDRPEPDDGRARGGLGVSAILARERLRSAASPASANARPFEEAGASPGSDAADRAEPAVSPSEAALLSQMSLMRRIARLELFRDYCERRDSNGGRPAAPNPWPPSEGGRTARAGNNEGAKKPSGFFSRFRGASAD